ncbi:class I SAM-dependent methyltransferase [Methanobacterium alcaliphilum]|uniref:class I SAM-dependent methyltransferase n=1 Tax=Methanobacterium alcaliphilum TaxID=392018 RepID=UPI00200A8F44|nr:class I SAM-dependent methyltransferase [Methanobacterium alcaliphilum]MCK9152272.1 class I SAM-dependent methyltransferase [Methanobacterium alcaliphilum]
MEPINLDWGKETSQNYCKDSAKLIKNDYLHWAIRIHEKNIGIPHPKIADIGCGPGFLSFELNKLLSGKYYFVDSSKDMVNFAKQEAKKNDIDAEFIISPAENPALPDNSVDIVICKHILLSLSGITSCLENIYRILADGGCVNIIDANPQSSKLMARVISWYAKMTVSKERAEKSWNAYLNGISHANVVQEMNRIGFKEVNVSFHFPMAYFITATK